MANRSYLYSLPGIPVADSPLPSPIKGLSEWGWDVPVAHLLLVGSKTEICPSALWEPRIGICGEYDPGKTLLLRFLKHLRLTGKMHNPDAYTRAVMETEIFLSDTANKQSHVLLEAGEIFSLSDDAPEQLAEDFVLFRIGSMVREANILLKTAPGLVFGPGSKDWINSLQHSWEDELGITNWTNTLFHSF